MFMEYTRTQMRKELILRKLKDKGFRITKQRLILLDIILSEKCTCCKEIYYMASFKRSKSIAFGVNLLLMGHWILGL